MRREGRDDERTCPRCGGAMQADADGSPTCGSCAAASAPLVRVVHDTGGSGHEPPPAVQLIREFKGPTVEGLTRDDTDVGRLPGQLRRVAQAVSMGDLHRAEERLDKALGRLHQGPGFRRRRWLRVCRLVLWVLLGVLLALVLRWGL